MAARSSRAGFTLIELTVVILLLGLTVMAVAVGGYMGFRDKEQLKDAESGAADPHPVPDASDPTTAVRD